MSRVQTRRDDIVIGRRRRPGPRAARFSLTRKIKWAPNFRPFGRQRRSFTAPTRRLPGREEPCILKNTMTRRKAEMQSYTWSKQRF
jgi:hypothetical protein